MTEIRLTTAESKVGFQATEADIKKAGKSRLFVAIGAPTALAILGSLSLAFTNPILIIPALLISVPTALYIGVKIKDNFSPIIERDFLDLAPKVKNSVIRGTIARAVTEISTTVIGLDKYVENLRDEEGLTVEKLTANLNQDFCPMRGRPLNPEAQEAINGLSTHPKLAQMMIYNRMFLKILKEKNKGNFLDISKENLVTIYQNFLDKLSKVDDLKEYKTELKPLKEKLLGQIEDFVLEMPDDRSAIRREEVRDGVAVRGAGAFQLARKGRTSRG
jgi:hypothetical protein